MRDIFDKIGENKVKMRLLLSLVGVEKQKVAEHAVSIKKLLLLGSNPDKHDPWVNVIAGLVHRRLFNATTRTKQGASGADGASSTMAASVLQGACMHKYVYASKRN
jgi:hypothetical protein